MPSSSNLTRITFTSIWQSMGEWFSFILEINSTTVAGIFCLEPFFMKKWGILFTQASVCTAIYEPNIPYQVFGIWSICSDFILLISARTWYLTFSSILLYPRLQRSKLYCNLLNNAFVIIKFAMLFSKICLKSGVMLPFVFGNLFLVNLLHSDNYKPL